MRLAGAHVRLRPSGALWLEAEGLLAVADLHFEKGSAYAARGQMLPPYDTGETLGRLEDETAALAPRTLVFLGDSFHDRAGEARLAGQDAVRLERLARAARLIWVVGNHDAEGPRALPGEVAPEWRAAGLVLRHEPRGEVGEVAGHLHPAARVSARGRSVRRRCFVTDGERLILPAFGAFAGGLSVRDPAIAGLFKSRPQVVALGTSRAYAVGWSAVMRE
jgi:DNA ligase-associated metallophosphoesterase